MSDFLPVNGQKCKEILKPQYHMDLPVYMSSVCINISTAIVAEFGGCSAGMRAGHVELSTVPATAAPITIRATLFAFELQ